MSHDPSRWNFSESTNLSEVLLVAVKEKRSPAEAQVISLNLWRNPSTAFEALAIFNASRSKVPDPTRGEGSLHISIGENKVGEATAVNWQFLRERVNWMLPAAFAQSELINIACHLLEGRLRLPGQARATELPLCTIHDLGKLGPDARDIHDGFSFSEAKTPYPAFLDHAADSVFKISQKPNRYLLPLGKAKANRPLRKLEHLWPLAGRVLLAERLRLNTQKLAAVRIEEVVLSNMWWSFLPHKPRGFERKEKAVSLWLNSTIGLLILLAHREETEGAWVKFKKPTLSALPTLNVDALKTDQLRAFSDTFEDVSSMTFQPFPHMSTDTTRAAIDGAIAKILNLPDFSIVRKLLAQEPVVCLKRL